MDSNFRDLLLHQFLSLFWTLVVLILLKGMISARIQSGFTRFARSPRIRSYSYFVHFITTLQSSIFILANFEVLCQQIIKQKWEWYSPTTRKAKRILRCCVNNLHNTFLRELYVPLPINQLASLHDYFLRSNQAFKLHFFQVMDEGLPKIRWFSNMVVVDRQSGALGSTLQRLGGDFFSD